MIMRQGYVCVRVCACVNVHVLMGVAWLQAHTCVHLQKSPHWVLEVRSLAGLVTAGPGYTRVERRT